MNLLVLTGNVIRFARAPRLHQKSYQCKRLENGVDQTVKTTDLFMTSSAG